MKEVRQPSPPPPPAVIADAEVADGRPAPPRITDARQRRGDESTTHIDGPARPAAAAGTRRPASPRRLLIHVRFDRLARTDSCRQVRAVITRGHRTAFCCFTGATWPSDWLPRCTQSPPSRSFFRGPTSAPHPSRRRHRDDHHAAETLWTPRSRTAPVPRALPQPQAPRPAGIAVLMPSHVSTVVNNPPTPQKFNICGSVSALASGDVADRTVQAY